MSNVLDNLWYTEHHEWALIDGEQATFGITDFAQQQFGEIVSLDLPKVGTNVTGSEAYGTIESVKAVTELFAPLSGKVVEVNEELSQSPEDVNSDPYGDGWLVKVELSDPSEAESLMSPADYKKWLVE
jgi:glycine cleavage system H protein